MSGLRERKRVRTREALATAAKQLFAERGYTATTVEQIAAAAEVSPRTFFRYFPAKEDVLLVDMSGAFDRWAAAFEDGSPGESLLAAVQRATLAVNAEYEARRADFDLFQRLAAEDSAVALRAVAFDQEAQQRAAVRIGEALGLPQADLRPHVVAAAVMGAVRVTTGAWAAAGGDGDRAAAVEAAFDVLRGLSDLLATPVRERP